MQKRVPRHRTIRILLFALLLACSVSASAFPGFARKYSPETSVFTFMPCSSCHEIFPRLTPFGRDFKERGFRMPGESMSWSDSLRFAPVAARIVGSSQGVGSSAPESSGASLKAIAAGSLGSWFSYWAEQRLSVNGEGVSRARSYEAWLGVNDVLRNLRSELLNVKVGQFELDVPFSRKRSHNLFSYDAYDFRAGAGRLSLGGNRRGIELSGRPTSELRYSFALADADDELSVRTPELFARVSWDFDGQHRVGVILNRADFFSSRNDTRPSSRVTRLGADLDLRYPDVGASLFGGAFFGRVDDLPGSNHASVFVQFDKHLTHWLMMTTRYTVTDYGMATFDSQTFHSVNVGAQSWIHERLRLAIEYRFESVGRPSGGAVLIDFVL